MEPSAIRCIRRTPETNRVIGMIDLLKGISVILVALAWALAIAHALEMPGKLRLDRETYIRVQGIYYPGFTIAGASEPLAVAALILLLLLLSRGSPGFPCVVVALAGMIAVQAIYWLVVHPVNRHWMAGQPTGRLGRGFFEAGGARDEEQPDWVSLRGRWESGHLLRAIAATISLLSMTVWLVGPA